VQIQESVHRRMARSYMLHPNHVRAAVAERGCHGLCLVQAVQRVFHPAGVLLTVLARNASFIDSRLYQLCCGHVGRNVEYA
jgi:hypothetical protein